MNHNGSKPGHKTKRYRAILVLTELVMRYTGRSMIARDILCDLLTDEGGRKLPYNQILKLQDLVVLIHDNKLPLSGSEHGQSRQATV